METFKIHDIPTVVYGEPSDKVFLFVHGKNGQKEEAAPFAAVVAGKGYQVLGIDLPEHGERKGESGMFDPWHAVPELQHIYTRAKNRWEHISLRATSIGAYFSLLSLAAEEVEQALFVSPILDMERLIGNMMTWSGVTEEQLEQRRIIPTNFGETLSWEYLSYVRSHRIEVWNAPTSILYGTADNLTERETVGAFVQRFRCQLTEMDGGEHWFHTPEQLEVQERWTRAAVGLL